MDVTRAADIIRANESTDALPTKRQRKLMKARHPHTSSGRFNFSSFTEDPSIDHIDKVGSMFTEFRKKPPTLREALESMGYDEKIEEPLRMFTEKANGRLEEIEAPGLSAEDVATIFCYTYEWDEEKFGKVLTAHTGSSTSLFLSRGATQPSGRHAPSCSCCSRRCVNSPATCLRTGHCTEGLTFMSRQRWTLSTLAESLTQQEREDVVDVHLHIGRPRNSKEIVERNKGTLLTLSGEVWGYDISVFSNYPDEKEVLLEPERKLRIKDDRL